MVRIYVFGSIKGVGGVQERYTRILKGLYTIIKARFGCFARTVKRLRDVSCPSICPCAPEFFDYFSACGRYSGIYSSSLGSGDHRLLYLSNNKSTGLPGWKYSRNLSSVYSNRFGTSTSRPPSVFVDGKFMEEPANVHTLCPINPLFHWSNT